MSEIYRAFVKIARTHLYLKQTFVEYLSFLKRLVRVSFKGEIELSKETKAF